MTGRRQASPIDGTARGTIIRARPGWGKAGEETQPLFLTVSRQVASPGPGTLLMFRRAISRGSQHVPRHGTAAGDAAGLKRRIVR